MLALHNCGADVKLMINKYFYNNADITDMLKHCNELDNARAKYGGENSSFFPVLGPG